MQTRRALAPKELQRNTHYEIASVHHGRFRCAATTNRRARRVRPRPLYNRVPPPPYSLLSASRSKALATSARGTPTTMGLPSTSSVGKAVTCSRLRLRSMLRISMQTPISSATLRHSCSASSHEAHSCPISSTTRDFKSTHFLARYDSVAYAILTSNVFRALKKSLTLICINSIER